MVWLGVLVMRKWVILFLVLLNVVVFFGFTMHPQSKVDRSIADLDQIMELRLVSEVPKSTLVRRAKTQNGTSAGVAGSCYYYSDVTELPQREEILLFLSEEGLMPVEFTSDVSDWMAAVYISTDPDRELINKINNLLKDVFDSIKIEKKVCKGLASGKVDQ